MTFYITFEKPLETALNGCIPCCLVFFFANYSMMYLITAPTNDLGH